MIQLRAINEDNFEECLKLHTDAIQTGFVDCVARSLAEAWVLYEHSRPFAIYADAVMVGYVSMYVGDNNPQIINFMIDSRFQKRGYGTVAGKLCINYLCTNYNAKRISLPVKPENIAAQKFWRGLGFQLTDDIESGYRYMRLYVGENEPINKEDQHE